MHRPAQRARQKTSRGYTAGSCSNDCLTHQPPPETTQTGQPPQKTQHGRPQTTADAAGGPCNQPDHNELAISRNLQRTRPITITVTHLSAATSPDRGRRERHLHHDPVEAYRHKLVPHGCIKPQHHHSSGPRRSRRVTKVTQLRSEGQRPPHATTRPMRANSQLPH